jgi:uncharacterized protein (DUF2336 family)
MSEQVIQPGAMLAPRGRELSAPADRGGGAAAPAQASEAVPEAVPEAALACLDASDVGQLRSDRMGPGAAKVARKVAAAYANSTADEGERAHGEAIIAEWLQRGDEVVRVALADPLAACAFLPHQFARAMAGDVAPVAVPILSQCEVLTEEDLCDIAAAAETPQLMAIAARAFVPHLVSDVLIVRAEPDVTVALLGNEGAKLSEPALHRIMDAFNKNNAVIEALTGRGRVPSSVADRLVTLIAEPPVQEHERPHSPFAQMLSPEMPRHKNVGGMDAALLADQFASAGRLSTAFLLRALCDGRRNAFEAGIARLAGLPVDKATALLISGDEEALVALFKRAGVAAPFRQAFFDGIEGLIRDAKHDPGQAMSAEQICEAVLEVFKNDDTINRDEASLPSAAMPIATAAPPERRALAGRPGGDRHQRSPPALSIPHRYSRSCWRPVASGALLVRFCHTRCAGVRLGQARGETGTGTR